MSRGNTTARGYGHQHQQARAAYLAELARRHSLGVVTQCARCADPIYPGDELHLDHTDDRRGYRGLSHASCNTSAGAQKREAQKREAQIITSRDW